MKTSLVTILFLDLKTLDEYLYMSVQRKIQKLNSKLFFVSFNINSFFEIFNNWVISESSSVIVLPLDNCLFSLWMSHKFERMLHFMHRKQK